MNQKYTKELLEPLVLESRSVRQVVQKLGLSLSGGNCNHIKTVIDKFQIDTKHFLGQSSRKGTKPSNTRPISDYLSNKAYINSNTLKNKLFNGGYFDRVCCNCKLTEWLKQPIPLELHHKDGDHNNNNINNLTILCPNCHACSHKA